MIVFRIILFSLHILVLLLILGTSLNCYIPPKVLPILNLLSIGYPILIIVYVLLTLYWLISFKKRGVLFFIIFIFFIKPIQRWVNYSSNDIEKSDSFSVISYNTKNISPEKEKFLNEQKADVILLQESGWGERIKYNLSEFKYSFNSQVVSIYSKYSIINKEKIDLNNDIGHGLYVDIEIKNRIIRFITIYLEPFRIIRDDIRVVKEIEESSDRVMSVMKKLLPVFKIHQEQIDIIKKIIKESPYPVVLGVDLNATPNSYEYYQISELLEDTFVKAGKGSGTSFHDYGFPIRIDYIFASKELRPINYVVDRKVKLSDHYPVYATLSID